MNLIRNLFTPNATSKVVNALNLPQRLSSLHSYHTLFKTMDNSQQPNLDNSKQSSLLSPASVLTIPVCGFKFKDVVRRRCKDCYIVVKDRQQIVLCKTYPRHKQKQKMPKEKDTWIITHRTQGRIRPW